MHDPVLVGGHTYDRVHIANWFAGRRAAGLPCTSPVSNAVLVDPVLEPNRALRDAIGHFHKVR